MISIVTPVYNEEDNVIFFHDAVTRVMKETGMAYELIYVDDGSHDRTNELICGLAEKDPHVRALTFARNFGHQIAITCGMDFARGDAVITMDGDMQHPPALIPTLIGKWKEGYDIVQTVRTATEDAGPIKKITSAGYYTSVSWTEKHSTSSLSSVNTAASSAASWAGLDLKPPASNLRRRQGMQASPNSI